MWLSLLLALTASAVLAALAANRFSSILNSPPLLSLILTLALYIPFSVVFLLPIDLVSSAETPPSAFLYVHSKKAILVLWRVNYWLGFLLTWLVLPLVQCFYSSNNFVFPKRLRDSALYNLKFYLVYCAAGLVGLVYVYFSVGLSLASAKALAIILSHSYSLILAIWFMGYGVVNLPKALFWDSLTARLRDSHVASHYFVRLFHANDDYHTSRNNFKQMVALINNLYSIRDLQHNEYHRAWIQYLHDSVVNSFKYNQNITNTVETDQSNTASAASLQSNITNYNNRFNQDLVIVNNQLSDEYLQNITKNFKDSYYSLLIHESGYYALLKKVIKIQDIRDSRATKSLSFRAPNKTHSKVSVNYLINNILFKSSRSKYWYYYYVNPFALRVAAAVFGFLSILIILSELFHNSKFSLVNVIIFNLFIKHGWLTTLSIMVILSYMCFAALISLSKTKIFLVYKLILKNSNPSSCVWYSSYAIRLTVPLAYNFLTILNKQILSGEVGNNGVMGNKDNVSAQFQKTQFAQFLGNSINLLPLGRAVNNILPYFILVPVAIQVLQTTNKAHKSQWVEKLKRQFYLDELDFLIWEGDSDEEDDENFAYGNGNGNENGNGVFTGRGTPYQDDETQGTLLGSERRDRGSTRRLDYIKGRIYTIIKHELSNPKSLLNTYDDNYSIFDSLSFRHYLSVLKEKVGRKRGIRFSEGLFGNQQRERERFADARARDDDFEVLDDADDTRYFDEEFRGSLDEDARPLELHDHEVI